MWPASARAPDRAEHRAPPDVLPAEITASPLGPPNARALARLLEARHRAPDRALLVALVPGTSQQWGHHRAPPADAEARGERISREFADRLATAYALLDADVVRFVLISGGNVDPARPDYNESARGRAHLLAAYATRFRDAHDDALDERVLVDPLACHSTSNVRNGARLCAALGLDRQLIATTMPPNARFAPAWIPVLYQTRQGWYFLHHRASTFDRRCRRELGYTLGTFDWFTAHGRDGTTHAAVLHHGFDTARLANDAFGP